MTTLWLTFTALAACAVFLIPYIKLINDLISLKLDLADERTNRVSDVNAIWREFGQVDRACVKLGARLSELEDTDISQTEQQIVDKLAKDLNDVKH